MDGNSLAFTAIRGIQAGRAYYVIMVPLKAVPRLFKFEDDDVPAEFRAQRVLNKTRVPVIADYISSNADEYILSSLCASVDGEMDFVPAGAGGQRHVGKLLIDIGAMILINDGQHRRAAIEEAVRQRPTLGNETISVVIFADHGLKRSQQMFADLNIHATRPTKSLGLFYDQRDAVACLCRDVLMKRIPLFRDYTCVDRNTLSNRTTKLITFSSLHGATQRLLGVRDVEELSEDEEDVALRYWSAVVEAMPDWQRVQTRDVATVELRTTTIHAHGVAMQALGSAGRHLIEGYSCDWEPRVEGLRRINWSKSYMELWDGRAMEGGRIRTAGMNIQLVTNAILQTYGVPLSEAAQEAEDQHSARMAQAVSVTPLRNLG